MRNLIRREVGLCEIVPRGYGIAYDVDYGQLRVCYLIPLNWVVGWWRRACYWLGSGPADPVGNAFKRGWECGRNGREELSYERGYMDGMKYVVETLRGGFAKSPGSGSNV